MTTRESRDPQDNEPLPNLESSQEIAALRSAGFRLLLDTGEPATRAEWAKRSGVGLDRIEQVLESPAMRGRVELDKQGRLLGIAGLTLTPTMHRLDIEEETRWTWCALDAVGILGALHATGTIHSTDPHTGAAIEISGENGTPAGDTSIFILGGYSTSNIRQDWCPRVNFFANQDNADAWVAANDLEGEIVSVTDIAPRATAMWQPVTDPT